MEVRDGKGAHTRRQYILNVIDHKMAEEKVWAGKSKSYYGRKVNKPFRILPSKSDKTYVKVGEEFKYTF